MLPVDSSKWLRGPVIRPPKTMRITLPIPLLARNASTLLQTYLILTTANPGCGIVGLVGLLANSLLSRAGEAYDARDRGPNRKSRVKRGIKFQRAAYREPPEADPSLSPVFGKWQSRNEKTAEDEKKDRRRPTCSEPVPLLIQAFGTEWYGTGSPSEWPHRAGNRVGGFCESRQSQYFPPVSKYLPQWLAMKQHLRCPREGSCGRFGERAND